MPKPNTSTSKPLPPASPHGTKDVSGNHLDGGGRRFGEKKRQENQEGVRRVWLGAFFKAAIATALWADKYTKESTSTLPHSGASGNSKAHSNEFALALRGQDSGLASGLKVLDSYGANQSLHKRSGSFPAVASSTRAVAAAQPNSNNTWQALASRVVSSVQSSFSSFLLLPVAEAAEPNGTLGKQQPTVDLSSHSPANEELADIAQAELDRGIALINSKEYQKAAAPDGPLRRAIAILEERYKADPNSITQTKLAHSHRNLGVALVMLGQRGAAIAHLRRALDLDKKLHEADPTPTTLTNLLRSYYQLGKQLLAWGQPGAAVELLGQAVALCKKQYEEDPNSTTETHLAESYSELGVVLVLSDQPGSAIEPLGQVVALYKKQYEAKPTPTTRVNLAQSLRDLGLARMKLGQPGAAVAPLRQSRDLYKEQYEEDKNPTTQTKWEKSDRELNMALAELGQSQEAVATSTGWTRMTQVVGGIGTMGVTLFYPKFPVRPAHQHPQS